MNNNDTIRFEDLTPNSTVLAANGNSYCVAWIDTDKGSMFLEAGDAPHEITGCHGAVFPEGDAGSWVEFGQ